VPITIVECVPNFSEGRDAGKVNAIAEAVRSVDGARVLDCTMDPDHHRSVITFAASAETVGEAALRAVAKAVELIDLRAHRGAHPRLGAADVVPFVPVEGVTIADCVRIAEETGARIWSRLGVPVYLYEAAARVAERAPLENVRRGGFEGLREEVTVNPARRPDFGGPELHPTAGATIVGARKFLIAYNVNLNTADVEIARRIARAIRQSSGGMPCVKAMGVLLASRNQAQVSMNLTDFETTPVHAVYEAVAAEASRYGVTIAASELIGLVPRKALEQAAAHFLRIEKFRSGMILENRLLSEIE
jgi:glutamate formiminotransferase